MKYLIALVFAAAAVVAQKDGDKKWVYEENDPKLPGPSKWGTVSDFPDCALQGKQSPINVISSNATSKRFPDRQPRNWNIPLDMVIQNNGESLRFTYMPDGTAVPLLKGGPMPEGRRYGLYLGYLYFGMTDDKGSAHQVDGKSHAMELVLYEYGNQNDVGKPAQEVGAVSIVFDVKEEDNPHLQPVIEAVKKINKPGWARARTENFLNLLIDPESQKWASYRNDYYHYVGSSLTPPCEQNIYWILLQQPNYIGKAQIAELRKLTDSKGNPLGGKVRPVQPIGDRTVYKSVEFSSDLPV